MARPIRPYIPAFKGASINATVENFGSTVIVKTHAGHRTNTTGAGMSVAGGTSASARVQR